MASFLMSQLKKIDWPDPQAYDCHNNLYFDGRWLAITRLRTGDNDRSIGIASAQNPNLTLAAPSHSLQAYSQITFKWLVLSCFLKMKILLLLVMVKYTVV
mmetsp:Transcript_19254/g.24999  ORF Transcript_19254/g.24999 Transcript_19254/m.24999 type:complete len:100 (+) Transcript_19254:43-342(+)